MSASRLSTLLHNERFQQINKHVWKIKFAHCSLTLLCTTSITSLGWKRSGKIEPYFVWIFFPFPIGFLWLLHFQARLSVQGITHLCTNADPPLFSSLLGNAVEFMLCRIIRKGTWRSIRETLMFPDITMAAPWCQTAGKPCRQCIHGRIRISSKGF